MAQFALNLRRSELVYPAINAAVVSVRQISDAGGNVPETPFETRVPIPAGPIPPVIIEVPEGNFTLTARMPNGAADRKTVRTNSNEIENITFDIDHLKGRSTRRPILKGGMPPWMMFEHHQVTSRREKFSSISNFDGVIARGKLPVFASNPLRDSLQHGISAGRGYVGFDRFDLRAWMGAKVNEMDGDRSIQRWRMTVEGQYPHDAPLRRRPFTVVMNRGFTSLVMLPLPWPYRSQFSSDTMSSDESLKLYAPVDLLIDHTAEQARAVRSTLREPEFMALLGYLGTGLMTEAAAALGSSGIDAHLTRLIHDKIVNPLAAAGAAYVGLATSGDEAAREAWAPWLYNLMKWFRDLPDGAILYARDRIERGRTRQDLMDAKKALKIAVRRGVPLYTVGLQHLLNGLQLFAEAENDEFFDQEAKTMRDAVVRIANHVDPSQTFTVLTFQKVF